MARTVFSTLTERASHHLTAAHAGLVSERPGVATDVLPHVAGTRQVSPLADLTSEHRDLADALVHLGRTVRGRSELRRDCAQDRLLAALEDWADPRPWSDDAVPVAGPVAQELRQAARCIRAAADLWSTHRTSSGAPRSPEASMLRHPSMGGTAMRHWNALVGQSASVARELAGRPESLDPDAVAALGSFPRPARIPADLHPVPLPVARPALSAATDILDAIDDRIDRIHRHIWEVAESKAMSAAVLTNAASIGMLLARAAAEAGQRVDAAERRAHRGGERGPTPRPTPPSFVTLSDLPQWADVAAALTTLRTPDASTTVLQVERLDLARLLERALTTRVSTRADGRHSDDVTAERLTRASRRYRAVAAICATSIRWLHNQGSLYLAGRALTSPILTRNPELLAARLGDRIVPAPPALARRVEAQLHAIGSSWPSAGTAA